MLIASEVQATRNRAACFFWRNEFENRKGWAYVNKAKRNNKTYILIGVILATFLAAIEGTIIGPAGPSIVSDLGNINLLSWIFTSYLLTMAVTTPIFGKLSDLYGRKAVFITGCVLFSLGSLMCMFAHNMESLILYRAIQGIGAGALTPVTFTIIGDTYEAEERGKIQGVISSVWGISSLVGPLLGGYVITYFGWEWIFGFNVPFAILAVFFIARYMKEEPRKQAVRLDWAGAVTFTVGMTALLLVITLGGQSLAWSSPYLLLLAAGSVVCLVSFVWIEMRVPEPMVPLKLFRIRAILFSCIAALLVSSLIIGLTSYLPLWVQGVQGGDAASSGLALLPMSIGWLISSIIGGRILFSRGSRQTSLIGLTFVVVGALALIALQTDTTYWYLSMSTFLYGVGFGFSTIVFTIISQSAVGYHLRGSSTALVTFLRTLGQTIGAAVLGSLLSSRIAGGAEAGGLYAQGITQGDINSLLSPHGRELSETVAKLLRGLLNQSLHTLFIIMAVIAVVGWLVVWGLPNRVPQTETD